MNRRLLTIGSGLALTTAILWVAGTGGWLPGAAADTWSRLSLMGAVGAFGAAVLSRLTSPVSNLMASGRCEVCGHRTERGHVYCLDHLQETVNATRDQARGGSTVKPRSKPHAQSRS